MLEMDHMITEAFKDVDEEDVSDTEDPDLLVFGRILINISVI